MRILKETELRKVKVLGSGAFGTVYKVRCGAKDPGWAVPEDAWGVAKPSAGRAAWNGGGGSTVGVGGVVLLGSGQFGRRVEPEEREWRAPLPSEASAK